jgi:AraC-like DNA-binding protein
MNFYQILSGLEPFNKLEKDQIKKVAATFHPKVLSAGKTIILQGEPILEIGLIVSGRVCLIVSGNHNNATRFDILTKGDFLGLTTMALDVCSPISAFCESCVHCYFQSKENYLLMIESFPVVKDYFYKKALLRLAKAIGVMNEDENGWNENFIKSHKTPRFPRAIERSLIYIEKNFMNPLTLDEVARVNGMSKYHFCRVFNEKSGYTFKQYLNRKRIEKAKYLMKFEDMNVSEAGFAVGYNDIAYFSSVFHKIEGVSPSHYKKSLNRSTSK